MIDSRAFSYFLGIRKPPTDRPDPSDKKYHEIVSFKGNLSKNVEICKYSAKSSVLGGILGPKKNKLYGTPDSCFPFA